MAAVNKRTKNIPKPTHFGKNLRFLRRMNGLSQTAMAQKLDLTRNNIASYESGIVEPNMKKFLATCMHFNVDPKDMLQSIMSEKPSDISMAVEEPDKIVDKYLSDEMEQFVIQTNEMTKVFEGYKTFFEMRKETDTYGESRELYSTLQDLLELLNSLIRSNWNLIQSVYPQNENEEE